MANSQYSYFFMVFFFSIILYSHLFFSGWMVFSRKLKEFVSKGERGGGGVVEKPRVLSAEPVSVGEGSSVGGINQDKQEAGQYLNEPKGVMQLAVSKLGFKKWEKAVVVEVQESRVDWEKVAEVVGKKLALVRGTKLLCFALNKAIIFMESEDEFRRCLEVGTVVEEGMSISVSRWIKKVNTLRQDWFSGFVRWIYIVGLPFHLWSLANFEKIGETIGEVMEVYQGSVNLEALDVVRMKIMSKSNEIQYAPMVVSDGVDDFKIMIYANLTEENKWGGIWIPYTEEEKKKEENGVFGLMDNSKSERQGQEESMKCANKGFSQDKDCFIASLPRVCVQRREMDEGEAMLSPSSVISGSTERTNGNKSVKFMNNSDGWISPRGFAGRDGDSRRLKSVGSGGKKVEFYRRRKGENTVAEGISIRNREVGEQSEGSKKGQMSEKGDSRELRKMNKIVALENARQMEEEEVRSAKKKKVLENRIKKSARELKALLGGVSPDVSLVEENRRCSGIASRIGQRKNRAKVGAVKKEKRKVVLVESSLEENTDMEGDGGYTSTAMVVHSESGLGESYKSDERVSSEEYPEDDLVPETQAIVEARLSKMVDVPFLKAVGSKIGFTKREMANTRIKQAIKEAVADSKENKESCEEEEEILKECEEERMFLEAGTSKSWADSMDEKEAFDSFDDDDEEDWEEEESE